MVSRRSDDTVKYSDNRVVRTPLINNTQEFRIPRLNYNFLIGGDNYLNQLRRNKRIYGSVGTDSKYTAYRKAYHYKSKQIAEEWHIPQTLTGQLKASTRKLMVGNKGTDIRWPSHQPPTDGNPFEMYNNTSDHYGCLGCFSFEEEKKLSCAKPLWCASDRVFSGTCTDSHSCGLPLSEEAVDGILDSIIEYEREF